MRLPRRTSVRAAAVLACAALFAAGPAVAADEQAVTAGEALGNGKTAIELRYRYEHVAQDGFAQDADASNLRLRLNYATGTFRDWSGFAEFDYVAEVLADNFNSGGGTSPQRTQYPVVADPHGADLNQLYFDYAGVDDTLLRLGRQRILLDNQRFVGGVGWRQNEQTYDGVTLRYAGLPGVALQYSYVWRVNRIFGDRSPAGRQDGDIHLLHAAIRLATDWSLVPYGYFIDNEDEPAFSTTTVGARLSGKFDLGQQVLTVAGEYATQRDAASAPVDFEADYLRLDAGLALSRALSVGLGYEVLGGSTTRAAAAFRTPLATLHAFQGWADRFLDTPDAGIEDTFVSVALARAGWQLQAVWHRFAAESGGADWGNELDLSLGRSLGERYGLLVKAARFDGDAAAYQDVSKYWLMLTAAY
ncbi:MAG TPA: alginate export family protein [Woeseiaceae bacterium]|nr:alginate export family protein [Woeseiaceae bacterium]